MEGLLAKTIQSLGEYFDDDDRRIEHALRCYTMQSS
jgi:hypothetical protein